MSNRAEDHSFFLGDDLYALESCGLWCFELKDALLLGLGAWNLFLAREISSCCFFNISVAVDLYGDIRNLLADEPNTDRPTRDKAVASLRTYLQGKQQFSELELLKLWKGLFFCKIRTSSPYHQYQQRIPPILTQVTPSQRARPIPPNPSSTKPLTRHHTNQASGSPTAPSPNKT